MTSNDEIPNPPAEENILFIGATTVVVSTLVVVMLANPDGWQNLLRYFGIGMLVTLVAGIILSKVLHTTMSRRVWDTAIRSSFYGIAVYLVAGLYIANTQDNPGVNTPGLFLLMMLAVPAIFLASFTVALVLFMLFSRNRAGRQ